VRKLLAIAALAALTTSTAAAQSRWTAEIGIQGGYNHLKPAGTAKNDAISIITVPGASFITALYGSAPIYAIIPAGLKLAIEPQLGFSQLETGGSHATLAKIGLRADYALNANVYAAAGGALNYLEQSRPDHTQLGVQVAVGYRKPLTAGLNARLEANVTVMKHSSLLGPLDAYQILLGVSSSLKKGGAARARASKSVWDPAIGLSAGYFTVHPVSGANITGVAFPSLGGSGALVGLSGVASPTLFAIIPMAEKVALEPGLDVSSLSPATGTSSSAIALSGRIDYAVTGNWYAAGGGVLTAVKRAGKSGTLTGFLAGWGYRFHLAGAFGGRVEVNYLLSGRNATLTTPATNTLGLTFGAMMPLK
jgi:hypothetical protein